MVKVFQRACVRAGIKALYSEGFNPHLKMSLPLPKSVGIEVDDDLLSILVKTTEGQDYKDTGDLCNLVKTGLSGQLPDGFELLTVSSAQAKTSIQPYQAEYLLAVRQEHLNDNLKSRIKHLMESENLNLHRRMGPKNSSFKNINVRPFLKSIESGRTGITVECSVSSVGSIRVNEILELLELDYGMLSAPVRRTRVKWQISES